MKNAFELGVCIGEVEGTFKVKKAKYLQANLDRYRQDAPVMPLLVGGPSFRSRIHSL